MIRFRKYPILRDYVAVQNLGSGYYGRVYKSFKKENSTDFFAVKVFKRNTKPSHVAKMIQEVDIVKKLDHKNVVKFIEFVEEEKIRYIVFEFCDGGTLAHLLHNRKKLSESLTKLLLQQMVNGIGYLHSMSICHMDLKPENILLNLIPPYQIKIADFGLSHDFSDPDAQLRNAGTITYMAPEKILGLEYGLISDLWSLGVIVRECVTGKQLFSGYSCDMIRHAILRRRPILDPSSLDLSIDCRNLITSLLKYNPDKRLTLQELYSHPFVDMEHEISAHNYQKAKKIVETALQYDEDFDYRNSVPLYQEAILFLEAFANVEPNTPKRAALNMKIWEYERWIKIVQRNPDQHHVVVVQPLPDLNGPWYEIEEVDSLPNASTSRRGSTSKESIENVISKFSSMSIGGG